MDTMIANEDSIYLRASRPEDLDFVIEAENNKENRSFVAQWSRESHLDSLKRDNILHVIIVEKHSDISVGYIIMDGLNGEDKSLELKRLVITSKGKGYGRMALRAVKKLAFEILHFNRLWLDVREKNQRAEKLYKSEGFVEEGRLREAVMVDGIFESIKIMSILRREYSGNIAG